MDIQNTPKSPFSALEQWETDSRPVTLQQGDHTPFWGEDGFTFDDVLDMVNPLQHIPVASKQYQEATGDTASEGAKLVGGVVFGALTGGILGLVAALVNAAVRNDTGKDLTDHALALMEEESPTELATSATNSDKPAESGASADASIENKGSISATESPAYPQPAEVTVQSRSSVYPSPTMGDGIGGRGTERLSAERTDFFVDDAAARSLHPAERLLAISSYHAGNHENDRNTNVQQKLEHSSEASMEYKVSKAYQEGDARESGRFWWEV